MLEHLREEKQDPDFSVPRLLDDEAIRKWISATLEEEIDKFLAPCLREIRSRYRRGNAQVQPQRDEMCERARNRVEFFLFKSLNQFCKRKWSRKEYETGHEDQHIVPSGRFSFGRKKEIFGRDYYPAKLFHTSSKGEQLCVPL